MRFLLWLVYFLIAYGSLFPFNFVFILSADENALSGIFKLPSVGDILGNLALFIPLGLLHRMQTVETKRLTKFIRLLFFVGVFATLLQVFQLFLPGRDQNIYDVLFNGLGFCLGWFGFQVLQIQNYKPNNYLTILPLGISSLFFTSELIPLIPSVDFQLIKNSLKSFFDGGLDMVDIATAFVFWVMSFRLINWQNKPLPFRLFIFICAGFMIGKIITYHNYLTVTDVVSPLLALIVFRFQSFRTKQSIILLLVAVLFSYLVNSLELLSFSTSQAFNFIPFNEFLSGNLETNARNLLFKCFVFCGLFWLILEANWNFKKGAWVLFFIILITEVIQLWMPTKTSGISDPLLVLLSYALIRYVGDFLASKQESVNIENVKPKTTDNAQHNQKHIFDKSANAFVQPNNKYKKGLHNPLATFVLHILVLFVVIKAALSMPNVPYNILELFRNNGNILDIMFFYISIILLGGSCVIVANSLARQNVDSSYSRLKKDLNILCLYVFCNFAMFSSLYLSVSEESIADIVGSSLVVPLLFELESSNTIGGLFIKVFSLSNISGLSRYLELSLRFMALLGLLQIPLTFFIYLRMAKLNSVKRKALIGLISSALTAICYFWVFVEPSTDNLTELIERPVVLVFIAVLLALSVSFCAYSKKPKSFFTFGAQLLIFITVSVISWFLAQYGFKADVEKYGNVFSAFDFLLGPNRQEKLSNSALFFRWILVITMLQFVCVWGIYNAQKIMQMKGIVQNWQYFPQLSKVVKLWPVGLALFLVVYCGNRLFGSHGHWLTIKEYFQVTTATPFAIDDSKALIVGTPEAGIVTIDGKNVKSIAAAFASAKNHSLITIGKGHYNEAAVLTANDVKIFAEPGAVIYGKAVKGKGAMLIQGNNTYIEGLECHSVQVPDNNGVCVRLEGKGIVLNNVFFHHSQGGFLGSPKGGDILIQNSRFESLGDTSFFHGIYTLENTRLYINNSTFLNNRNSGHEIKSRSIHTEITHSIVASPNSKDSRLVDVPNGGTLILKENIFVEGPYSENHDLFSWGVEGLKYENEKITIQDNLIISDKPYANLVSLKRLPNQYAVFNNVVVGSINGIERDSNLVFESRAEANIAPAPFIPQIPK